MMTKAQKNRVMFQVAQVLTDSLCECGHWRDRHQGGQCWTNRCKCRSFTAVKFRRTQFGLQIEPAEGVAGNQADASMRVTT